MIGIRVDANTEIASGHVMRCFSIAHAMKNVGTECIFITADESSNQIVSSNGFEAICLHSQWNNLDREIEPLISLIREFKIDKLIIDSYYVTKEYFSQLMEHTKVVYIDDLNLFQYPISMIVNYNIYYERFCYPELYSETDTRLLLGCDYAPLRAEFKLATQSYREEVKKVLITTGGTDNYNVAGKLLKKIVEENLFRGIEFHVVVGAFNIHIDYIEKLIENNKHIRIYKNVKKISKLMKDCDIAITAGGSTMYELCACGTAAICFSFADNQLYGVKGFEEEDLMYYAGDMRDSDIDCIANIILFIQKYIENPKLRKDRIVNTRRKVDGCGAERLINAVVNL